MGNRSKASQTVLAAGLLLLIGTVLYLIGQYLWGDNRYKAAQRALDRRDLREASALLTKWLESHPGDPRALLLAAQAARRRGNLEEAMRYLHECERQGVPPDQLTLEQRLLRIQLGHLTEANALLASCFDHASNPNTRLILEAVLESSIRAAAKQDRPDLSQVQRGADLWLQQFPGQADQVQGLVWRGRASRILDHHPQAVADFRQAIQLDPDHFDARFYLAHMIAQEAPEEAATHFQRLRDREPDNLRTTYSLATLRRGLGQLEEARRLLEEILTADPNNVSALVEIALVALDRGQLSQAEPRLSRAVELAPRQPEVHLALARCRQQAGRSEEAKTHQTQFLRLEAESRRRQEQGNASVRP